MTLTVVFDNYVYDGPDAAAGSDSGLLTSWGFGCWVERGSSTVLFDTGGDGSVLLNNLSVLDLAPSDLDSVVLSHAHGDHAGGLAGLLETGITPTVYVPSAFPDGFKRDVAAQTELVEVTDAVDIAPGIRTTGEVGDGMIEQALVIDAQNGLVVLTGCAHPGVDQMVRTAIATSARTEVSQGGAPDHVVSLVMGGFHLGSASEGQVATIISAFEELGVQRVAPCHCTGDRARAQFAEAFGSSCTLAGVGYQTEMAVRH